MVAKRPSLERLVAYARLGINGIGDLVARLDRALVAFGYSFGRRLAAD
jgi:hypothetical protein